MPDVKTQVKSFLTENFFFGQDSGLLDEDSFLARGVLDSTGVLELVMFLEKTYAIKVLDNELLPDNLDSLNAIDAYVHAKLNGHVHSNAVPSLAR
jgi:acyl carrier protein